LQRAAIGQTMSIERGFRNIGSDGSGHILKLYLVVDIDRHKTDWLASS